MAHVRQNLGGDAAMVLEIGSAIWIGDLDRRQVGGCVDVLMC